MEFNLYANFAHKKGLYFKVISFDMKTAEILQGESNVFIHYDHKAGWLDSEGRQYRVTSKPQSFNPLKVVA